MMLVPWLFLVERKTRRRIMRRILKKLNPCWKVGEEASHITSTSAKENKDGVIVISDDDEE
jgi:hypothetical protein